MPIHDWTRVNSGTYPHFHNLWIAHISEPLNEGVLPDGFYAMAEQHFGQMIADVLTLRTDPSAEFPSAKFTESGPVAVAETPPRVHRKMVAQTYDELRKTVTVRRERDHRIVALIEIVSPGNKDRASSVNEFVKKVWSALQAGVHVLVVDLFAPTPFDPNGIHGEIWKPYDPEPFLMGSEKPLTLVSYDAKRSPEAYIEHAAVGDVLIDMPLFLDRDWYINVPLESTYQAAWRGVPKVWRDVIDSEQSA